MRLTPLLFAAIPPLQASDPPPLTVFTARAIRTMEDSMPLATAVAVDDGRIVAVGTLESLQPWIDERSATIDDRYSEHVLLPGFIDPHVHPSLPAILTRFPFLAPDSWSLPTGEFPGATTPDAYVAALRRLVEAHESKDEPLIAFGYHPLWHGTLTRSDLSEMFPSTPVILWHRSFHELYVNDRAIEWIGVTEADFADEPEADWANGHFWENGAKHVVGRIQAYLVDPEHYAAGMGVFVEMAHQAGVTTCLDMGIGIFGDAAGEIELIRSAIEDNDAPLREVLTPIITDFLSRGRSPEQALEEIRGWQATNSPRVRVENHFKLMMDGAIFSGLAQMGRPGYLDGHDGIWMSPLDVTEAWAKYFWDRGFQLHAHANGDASVAALISIVRRLQVDHPRVDHRATLEHFAYVTETQCRNLAGMGMLVSANPYYHYILSDIYAERWLGRDRGHNMVRLGSLERLGVPFALHSDCPMAPLDPLRLAACATRRVTINGNRTGQLERASLEASLRAITIDAAFVMGWEDEIGSIAAGKRADFVVLDADPLDVGVDGLEALEVIATIFEGNVAPVER